MLHEDNPAIINNSDREHAIIVLQEFFKAAKRSIHVQCSHFSKDIYETAETQEYLRKAVRENHIDVKIFVRDNTPQSRDFANELNSIKAGTVQYNKSCHKLDFCVVDGKRFRLEKDTSKRMAFVCTYNEELSSLLESLITAC